MASALQPIVSAAKEVLRTEHHESLRVKETIGAVLHPKEAATKPGGATRLHVAPALC